ncbi:MAG: helix-hairpin-helix domain-containing protein [Candidatus Bathyarchaeota archaeon]|nr:helix-hairpin-helix domain-containing protein [Candidatus Bathyarchaeota archaeon]
MSTTDITLTHTPSIKEEVEEVTEKTEPATPTHPIELISIEGIGVKRAEKLNSYGVNSVQDLADFDSKELSQKFQISEKRVSKWIDKAKDALKN